MVRPERQHRLDAAVQRVAAAVGLRDRVQHALALARDLTFRVRRVLHDVGENCQRRRQVSRQDVQPQPRALAPGAARERRAQIAEGLLDLERIARLGAQIDGGDRQVGDAGLAGRIAHRAGPGDQRDVDLRQIAPLDHEQLEAVGELRGLHCRRDKRPIRAQRRHPRSIERQRVGRALRLLGVEADDHAIRRVEPRGNRLLDRCRRQRTIPPQVGLDLVRVAQIHVVLVEHVGLAAKAADALEPGDELGLLLGLRTFELGDRRPFLRQARDLGRHALLDVLERRARARRGLHDEQTGDLGRDVERGHLRGQLLVVHERLGQPRRQPVGENPRGDVERCVVFVKVFRRRPADVDAFERDAIAHLDDALAVERRDVAGRPIQRRARRQVAEVLRHQLLGLGRIEVTRDDQREVVGCVVLPEELLDVVERGRRQVFHAADHRP